MKTANKFGSPTVPKFFSIAVLVAITLGGCAQIPDIRQAQSTYSGIIKNDTDDFFSCVRSDTKNPDNTFLVKEVDKSILFIGSQDYLTASGIVVLSKSTENGQFTVYQRDPGHDRGRLIEASLRCARA